MEYFDICNESGIPTGKTVSRQAAHTDGILHRTAHVWIVRQWKGRVQILLQKRSRTKDSFPGMFDTSSAGHIPAGDEPLPSALRELREELGIAAVPEQLTYAGFFRVQYERIFHDRLFRDNEYVNVFVFLEPVDIQTLTLQKEEVEEVRWFDLDEVYAEIQTSRKRFCVPIKGLQILIRYLQQIGISP